MAHNRFLPVDEQMTLLMRGVVHVASEAELRARLEKSYQTGKPLRIKAGFDPTAADLHLGHTVLMSKMRAFQRLGHEVIFLVGDFTAMIGDPTGRNELRPPLSRQQVLEAAQTYESQALKVLAQSETRIEYNGSWFDDMTAREMIALSAKYTVSRMLERDDFHKRFNAEKPIHIHEFLYPLVQGYDSVVLQCDVELGGQDQLFNLLVGRDLMRDYGLLPQIVMTTSLLLGTDARTESGALVGDKMSKSKGNYVALNDPPREMFGKVMSISDALMWNWYTLLSEALPAEIEAVQQAVENGQLHPKTAKERLAHELVNRFHGQAAADEALAEFGRVFSGGGVPDEMPEVAVNSGQNLATALFESTQFESKSEIRRLITQGAVSCEGQKWSDPQHLLSEGIYVVKIGKHRFMRLKVSE